MGEINSITARFLCFFLGVIIGLAAYFVGFNKESLLQSAVFVFLAIVAAVNLVSAFVGTDTWRNRLIGLWPGI